MQQAIEDEIPENERQASFPKELDAKRLSRCKEQCGICFLDVSCLDEECTNDENQSNTPSAQGVIGILESCIHTFHGSCIETWADCATTCPQCKATFSYIGYYSLEGKQQHVKYCVERRYQDFYYRDERAQRAAERIRRRGRNREERERPSRRRRAERSRTNESERGRGIAAEIQRQEETRRQEEEVRRQEEEIRRREEEVRRQLRRGIETARRRRLCMRTTEEKAKQSIDHRFKMLPYQQQPVVVSTRKEASSSRSDEQGLPLEQQECEVLSREALSELSLNGETSDATTSMQSTMLEQVVPRVVVPLQHAKPTKPSFDDFKPKSTNYSTDFLLK